MKKRGLLFNTYGRSTTLSKQNGDFDKVFSGENSSGNSVFGTSDSSAGRSPDFTDSPCHAYDLRRSLCSSLRDVSNVSSPSQDSLTSLKPPPRASQAKKVRGRRKRTVKADTTQKENFDPSVPDYDDIAEDSFVIETETDMGMTKCSTPLVNASVRGSEEIPVCTPIFHDTHSEDRLDHSEINISPAVAVRQSGKLPTSTPKYQAPHSEGCLDASEINFSADVGKFDDAPTDLLVTRRSSRLKSKLIASRKLLMEDNQIISLTPDKNLSGDCAPVYHSPENVGISGYESVDQSADDLLKKIGQNISHLAAINLSLDDVMIKSTTTSPLENHPSSSCIDATPVVTSDEPSFSASRDLFSSLENTNLEGLSCIPEEESAYDDSLHSVQGASNNLSKSLLVFLSRLSTHSVCDNNELQTAKEKLFDICDQEDYISFSTCIPSRMMNKCVKIGEGVYGEVFRSISRDQNVAIKIIPMEGNFNVNDCPQKTFEELLPEAVIAKELSDLACGFCHVNRISCVEGSFPPPLLKEWDAYAQRTLSENDRPDIFPNNQLFAVFEFADGGAALEKFEMSNHKESLSVLRQVVFALAVAENNLEFEHRDLHIGNILVKRSQDSVVKFSLGEDDVVFSSEGVIATIIDFTISRLKKDGCAVFCDISTDDGLFEGSGDIQFDVYRNMRETNENDWSKFCPYSNVLWIQYLCKKLLTVIKVKDTGREHRESLRRLRQLNEKIIKYESAFHLAMDSELWNF